jgi:hypothetical protein
VEKQELLQCKSEKIYSKIQLDKMDNYTKLKLKLEKIKKEKPINLEGEDLNINHLAGSPPSPKQVKTKGINGVKSKNVKDKIKDGNCFHNLKIKDVNINKDKFQKVILDKLCPKPIGKESQAPSKVKVERKKMSSLFNFDIKTSERKDETKIMGAEPPTSKLPPDKEQQLEKPPTLKSNKPAFFSWGGMYRLFTGQSTNDELVDFINYDTSKNEEEIDTSSKKNKDSKKKRKKK